MKRFLSFIFFNIDDIKERVGGIAQRIKECLEHEESPWGRLKKCGRPETCKEVKDRILGRTIFMTPTGANEEVSFRLKVIKK